VKVKLTNNIKTATQMNIKKILLSYLICINMFTTSEDFTMAISIAKTNVNAPSSKLEDDTVRIVRPTNVSHTMM
jgi:hypothetical protein